MKFKSPIEVQSSIKDSGNSPGSAGQVLTSTVNGVDWVDQGAIAAESAEVVEVPVKNTHTTTILKGTPVYISGSVGSSGRLEVKPANASVEASMPALGLLKQDLAVNAEGFCVISGKLRNLITSPIDGVNTNEGDVVYVKAGGGLTTTKPGGADNFIQNMGKVGVSSTSNNGTFIVSSILRSNDVPNLPEGRLFVGTSDNTSLTSDVVYIDDTNDRVGIGTDSPAKKLHVQHSSINPSSVYGTLLVEENNEASVGILGTSYSSVYFGDAASPYAGGIIYAHGDDHLQFRVSGNSEKMRITSSGNVGIGTTSPSAKLHIQNGSSGQAYTLLSGALIDVNGTSNSYSALRVGSSAGSNHLVVTNAGNVGIGVTSPGAKLDVAGGARISVSGGTSSILELRNDNDGDSFVRYYDEGSGDAWSAGLDASDSSKFKIAYGQDSDSLTVGTKMVIQTNGNVGIGTTGPGYKLDVNGGGGIRVKDASNPLIYFSRTNGVNGGIGMTDDTKMRFAVGTAGLGSNTKMVINSSGNVGIGTTSPNAKLSVKSSGANNWVFRATASDGGDLGGIYEDGGTNAELYIKNSVGTSSVLINSNGNSYLNGGNVGIGTTNPSAKLHITIPQYSTGCRMDGPTGTLAYGYMSFYSGTNYRGAISTTSTGVNYASASDYRLKENVTKLQNSTEKIKKLKPSNFNFLENPSETVDGFIAHELQEIVPEAVTGEKDAVGFDGKPSYQGVDQSKIVPLLTAALQEAISKIEQLETRIQTLENK